MIKATGLEKSYGTLKVLRGVDVEIGQGEVVSIVGKSGAGKSTLLHILGTLDVADKGKVEVNSKNISALSSKDLAIFRNSNIGFIFQFHHLLPEFTALENVIMPALIHGDSVRGTPYGEGGSKKRAFELLDYLGLKDRVEHKPNELSGGEQQRVAVARALMMKPAVVFADEPSGNLDSASSKDLHNLIFKLREDFNQTFVIVTHNEELANMSDRRLVMQDGLLVV
jgi:lipoprotein-releasing system ATP-binding protein